MALACFVFGCTVPSDVAEAVRAQRAHYARALKANQPLLLAEARAAFARRVSDCLCKRR